MNKAPGRRHTSWGESVPNNLIEASIELGIKCQKDFKDNFELEILFNEAINIFRNEINSLGGKIVKENLEKR